MEYFKHFCQHQHIKCHKSTYLTSLDLKFQNEKQTKGEQFLEAKYYYLKQVYVDSCKTHDIRLLLEWGGLWFLELLLNLLDM